MQVILSPGRRRTAFFFSEHTIEIGPGGKTAFGGNDVVAIVWKFQHHLFGCIETDFTQPNSECGLLALVKELGQLRA